MVEAGVSRRRICGGWDWATAPSSSVSQRRRGLAGSARQTSPALPLRASCRHRRRIAMTRQPSSSAVSCVPPQLITGLSRADPVAA